MADLIYPKRKPTPSDPASTATVDGAYSVELRINDSAYPVSTSLLRNMRVISNIHTILPTFSFVANDLMSMLTNEIEIDSGTGEYTLGNGVKISIGLSDGSQPPDLHHFRLMSIPAINPGAGNADIRVVAVMDAMKWWRGICKGAFDGTSTDVLKKLAQECEIGFFGPHSFNDNMTWFPAMESYSRFANKISNHAWSDPSSCAAMAMDRDMVLRYVDLNRLADEKPIATAKYLKELEDETDFEVMHCTIKAPSGAANLIGGYEGTLLEQNYKGNVSEYSTVQAVRHGDYIDRSKSINDNMGSVRSRLSTLGAGNFHENYHRAEHQNDRLLNTFNLHAEIYTESWTNIGLFETVKLDIGDQRPGEDQRNYSGTYFVTAKVAGINNNRYFERIRLTSNSRGFNPAKDLT